jgi:hypothetical protein
VNSIDILWQSRNVVNDVTEVGGKDNLWNLVTKSDKLLVGGLECSEVFFGRSKTRVGSSN